MFSVRFACLNGQLQSISLPSQTRPRPKIACTWDYRVIEWLRGGVRVDTLLQQISAMLNSNEQLEMDDSFQLSLTHVRTPPMGSSGKHKLKPGHSALTSFKKRSCLCSSLRMETSFVVPEPSSLPKPELTNTPTATGSKEAEGSKQNMQ